MPAPRATISMGSWGSKENVSGGARRTGHENPGSGRTEPDFLYPLPSNAVERVASWLSSGAVADLARCGVPRLVIICAGILKNRENARAELHTLSNSFAISLRKRLHELCSDESSGPFTGSRGGNQIAKGIHTSNRRPVRLRLKWLFDWFHRKASPTTLLAYLRSDHGQTLQFAWAATNGALDLMSKQLDETPDAAALERGLVGLVGLIFWSVARCTAVPKMQRCQLAHLMALAVAVIHRHGVVALLGVENIDSLATFFELRRIEVQNQLDVLIDNANSAWETLNTEKQLEFMMRLSISAPSACPWYECGNKLTENVWRAVARNVDVFAPRRSSKIRDPANAGRSYRRLLDCTLISHIEENNRFAALKNTATIAEDMVDLDVELSSKSRARWEKLSSLQTRIREVESAVSICSELIRDKAIDPHDWEKFGTPFVAACSALIGEQLLVASGDLAQSYGTLEKIQFHGLDAVITADLESGRAAVKQRKKALAKCVTSLLGDIKELIERCKEARLGL